MLDNNDNRRDVEEQYISAGNTSNMRVEADRKTGADVMIAAGWSQSRVGLALLRLHSEWDGAAKQTTMTATDFMLLLGKLKSLPAIRAQVEIYCVQQRFQRPEAVASAVLLWWLDKVCHQCNGLGYEAIPGSPALSSRQCGHCHGSGQTKLPHGQAGRNAANWIDDCVNRGRQSLSKRLHNFQT